MFTGKNLNNTNCNQLEKSLNTNSTSTSQILRVETALFHELNLYETNSQSTSAISNQFMMKQENSTSVIVMLYDGVSIPLDLNNQEFDRDSSF